MLEGKEPFYEETLNMLKDCMITAKCDVVILDNTFKFEATDAYEQMKAI